MKSAKVPFNGQLKGNKLRRAKRKMWLLRKREWECLRQSRMERRRRFFPTVGGVQTSKYTSKHVSLHGNRLVIELPEVLDFEENYETTVSHFRALRSAVTKGTRIRSLRFDKLRFISPSAALVLASEVDRWNKMIGGRLRAQLPSWHPYIQRLLGQMGYFELLNLKRPDQIVPKRSTTFLPFKRGDIGAPKQGVVAKQLRIEIEELLGHQIQRHFLYEGLSEAITNVGQHAYQQLDAKTFPHWWLSASYDADNRVLCVMFYDQGEGIPHTLPRAPGFESIKDFFIKWKDSEKIEAAMEIGRSSTGKAERGKGLQNLIEFAKSHREGDLSIYSLRGLFRLGSKREGENVNTTRFRRDHEHSIGGTLIEWSVKL